MPTEGVVAGDAAEQPALLDPGRIEPGLHGNDGAVGGERVGGDVDDAALAELVGLGTRQEYVQAVRPEGQVGHLDLDQLRPAERAGEAEQDERAVPLAPQAAAAGAGQLDDRGGEQRGGLTLRACAWATAQSRPVRVA